MKRGSGFIVFLILFLLAVSLRYSSFFSRGQSLFLALFDDPTPRLSFYPWLVESTRQLKSGHFPLWCNLEGAGMPLLANYQSTPFNPFNLAFAVFPDLKLLDFIVLLKLLLLAVFTYLFGRQIRLSPLAAAAAAFIICFCGYASKYINHIYLNTELWVPAGLIITERILNDRATILRFLGLGILSALALIGGNPEAAFYFFLFIALYAILRGGFITARKTASVFFALAFGFFLCAWHLFSFADYFSFAWHFHTSGISAIDHPQMRWMFSLFFPWMFGPLRSSPDFDHMLAYLGLIPVMLSLMTIFRIRSLPRTALFFWIFTLVFLGLIYNLPPFSALRHLPVISQVRNARYGYFGVNFSIAMLAGIGLESFLAGKISSRGFGLAAAVSGLIGIAAFGLALVFPPKSPLPYPATAMWLAPLCLFLLAAFAGLAGVFSRRRKICAAVMIVFALISLFHYARGLKPVSEVTPAIWRYQNPELPPILKPIVDDPELKRFMGIEEIYTDNLNIICRLNDLRAYEALYPLGYVQAMAGIEGFPMQNAAREYFSHGWHFYVKEKNLGNPLLAELGLKYLVSDRELKLPDWQIIAHQQDHFLYLNKNARPRVWVKESSGAAVFQEAEITDYQPDKITVKISGARGAELVLADQYAPGWRAFEMPGKRELRIFQEGLLFRKIMLDRDTREIQFIYQSRGFQIGIFASLSSIFIFVILLMAALGRRS